jgi:hypothetical protein
MITFNNIRINSMASAAGVFAGQNFQSRWCSDSTTQTGFGKIIGEANIMENPCNTVTDPDSSDQLLHYFEEQVSSKFGKKDE